MANLVTGDKNGLKLELCLDNYWDFYLHKGHDLCSWLDNATSDGLQTKCLLSYIDFTDEINCLFDKFVLSKPEYVYENAFVTNTTLYNIGLCGVDNGIIRFQRDRTSNYDFYKLFTGSTLDLNTDRLKLFEVSGNTMKYSYDLSYDKEMGAMLNGGFFQGFFMTECEEYKVLPTEIGDAWHFELNLRKENFTHEKNNRLNDLHPSNKGFFLYIGTRAENKWALLYNKDLLLECSDYVDGSDKDNDPLYEEEYIRKDFDYVHERNYIQREIVHPYVIDGYFTEIGTKESYRRLSFIADDYYDLSDYTCCTITENKSGWFCCGAYEPRYNSDESFCKELKCPEDNGDSIVKVGSCNNIPDDRVDYLNYHNCNCSGSVHGGSNQSNGCCKVPLLTWRVDYYDNVNGLITPCRSNDKTECPIYIDRSEWLSDGAFDLDNEYAIIDCEYLKEDLDLTTITWETSDGVRLDLDERVIETDNKFLLFNRTKTGYTVSNWEEGTNGYFAFPTHNPSINLFPIMNRTCTGLTVHDTDELEKLRNDNRPDYDYKADVYSNALGFRITDDGRIGYRYITKDCDTNDIKVEEFYGKPLIENGKWYTVNVKLKRCGGKMRIYIYLDGRLILCSKYLPLLKLRALREESSKQESVPYNISVGGGSQGLCDVILPYFTGTVDKILPIEESFAGTFIGYIRRFRFYGCNMDKSWIEKNDIYDEI